LTLIVCLAVPLLPEQSIASTSTLALNFSASPMRRLFGFSVPSRLSIENPKESVARTTSFVARASSGALKVPRRARY
jgi:hypothetical protein